MSTLTGSLSVPVEPAHKFKNSRVGWRRTTRILKLLHAGPNIFRRREKLWNEVREKPSFIHYYPPYMKHVTKLCQITSLVFPFETWIFLQLFLVVEWAKRIKEARRYTLTDRGKKELTSLLRAFSKKRSFLYFRCFPCKLRQRSGYVR